MIARSPQNLVALFLERVARHGDRPFLWRRTGGRWASRSYAEARGEVEEAAFGLRARGLRSGDRVLLLSENRPEWLLADLAIMAAGGITVPAYVTNTVESHRHLLGNSQARAAIVSGPALLQSLLAAASPLLEFIICLDPPGVVSSSGPEIETWAALRDQGRRAGGDLATLADAVDGDALACIQHTSGTGGLPRGVMLTHRAILSNVEGGRRLFLDLKLEELGVFLSFLPASHSYEHTAGQYLPIMVGGQIYYVASATEVPSALLEVRPTILIAVPRLCEAMHRKIAKEVARKGKVERGLFAAALRLGRARYERAGRLSPVEALADTLLDRLVRRRVRARFGGRLRAIVSGGAPLSPELVLFFQSAGVPVLQGYGLTEAGPVVSCNPPGRVKIETVGPPMHGIEVRIADDGEILVRGENVMRGYWNEPEATAAALREGWLLTGDVGRLDDAGYLTITDRKKDFSKTTGGEMVSPQEVEGMLTLEPEIAQAIVIGDRRPHLVALVVPDAELALARAERGEAKAAGEREAPGAGVDAALHAAVERANLRLAAPERVRRIAVLHEPFTVENALMTPTLKLRRHAIAERYAAEIERLYEGRAAKVGR
jgi:long-chain acyl-CoA synthetase